MSETRVNLIFSNDFQGELDTARAKINIGKGEGDFKPYELLLGSLGACFYATFIGIAQKMRLVYESASIDIRGVKREDVPTTLKTVDMVFTIHGAQDQKGFERASKLAAQYCSIHETISKVAQIDLQVKFL